MGRSGGRALVSMSTASCRRSTRISTTRLARWRQAAMSAPTRAEMIASTSGAGDADHGHGRIAADDRVSVGAAMRFSPSPAGWPSCPWPKALLCAGIAPNSSVLPRGNTPLATPAKGGLAGAGHAQTYQLLGRSQPFKVAEVPFFLTDSGPTGRYLSRVVGVWLASNANIARRCPSGKANA
jgi:hypothetical protein